MDVSLFERKVKNGLPVKSLNIQHRMRPEISSFMRNIYPQLEDHSSTRNRPVIRGRPLIVDSPSDQEYVLTERG